MKTSACLFAGAALTALAGCAETPRVDAEFGNSVRHMVEAQTLDPEAARNPPAEAPAVADGQRVESVLEGYRKDVSRGTEDVRREVDFSVGK
jgi:hypothetical protein